LPSADLAMEMCTIVFSVSSCAHLLYADHSVNFILSVQLPQISYGIETVPRSPALSFSCRGVCQNCINPPLMDTNEIYMLQKVTSSQESKLVIFQFLNCII